MYFLTVLLCKGLYPHTDNGLWDWDYTITHWDYTIDRLKKSFIIIIILLK